MENILNKQSGVQAISGLVPDFREIENWKSMEIKALKIALDNFKYAIASYIAKSCSCNEWCRLYYIYRRYWRKSN